MTARLALALAGFSLVPAGQVEAASLGALRLKSALGERFDATVTIRAGEGETLSNACFQLVEPKNGMDSVRVLRQASLELQGKQLRIRGLDVEVEPLLKLVLRLQCPQSAGQGVSREYSLLLDPPGFQKPAAESPLSVAPPAVSPAPTVAAAHSISRARAGDSAERLARRYYPKDAGKRAQFVADLQALNPGLLTDPKAPLPQEAYLAMPPLPVAERKVSRPARETAPLRQEKALRPARARLTKEPAAPAVQEAGEFRLQLSLQPLDAARVAADLPEPEKLKLRERALLLEADDQVAQLQALQDRIHRLERQLASMSASAPAVTASALPGLRLAAQLPASPVAEQKGEGHYWLWSGLALVLLGCGGYFWYWLRQRRQAESEQLFSFGLGPFSEPQPETDLGQVPAAVAAMATTSSAASTVASSTAAAEPMPLLEEWDKGAQVDVVQPETLAEEVQLLLDHGMTAQAIALLHQEISVHPNALVLWLKLFDAYQQAGDRKHFADQAQAFHAQFLSPALWGQVQARGRELDPDNPLYQASAGEQGETASPGQASSLKIEPREGEPSGNDDFDLPDLLLGADGKPRAAASQAAQPAFSPEFQLPEITLEALPGSAADEPQVPMFSADAPTLELSSLQARSQSHPLTAEDFITEDPQLQEIAGLILAGQREQAYQLLESLLYRGTFEQRLLAAKWLDKLIPTGAAD